ncbi:MAG: hypothetical protein RMJ83_04565 [Armatimonadota bacterium]|nr:hypothetical protein [Armatimonadota bacterium]
MRAWGLLGLLLSGVWAFGQPTLQTITVEAEGVAAARAPREQAIREAERDALLQAVETACGVQLAGLEIGRDWALQQSARMAFAQGVVLRWTRLDTPREANGCIYVRVRAEVAPLAQLRTPEDWSAVWRTLGHPPLTLHWQGTDELALDTPTREALHRLLSDALRPMGVQLSRASVPNAWKLIAEVRLLPLKRWNDPNAPYGTGDLFASWRVHLSLRLKPPAGVRLAPLNSEDAPSEVLLLQGEAQAVSYLSDIDAIQRALRQILERSATCEWQQTLSRLWVNALLYGTPPTTLKPAQPTSTEVKTNATNHQRTRSQSAARTHTRRTKPRRA